MVALFLGQICITSVKFQTQKGNFISQITNKLLQQPIFCIHYVHTNFVLYI